jgi:hypothetical protein
VKLLSLYTNQGKGIATLFRRLKMVVEPQYLVAASGGIVAAGKYPENNFRSIFTSETHFSAGL